MSMSKRQRGGYSHAARVLTTMVAIGIVLSAQQAPPASGLTVAQAVDAALRNYPSVQVSQEQINAAAAGIQLARTAYLPRVDAMAQVNRATRNNVFGMLLPQSVIPSISGPVLGIEQLRDGLGQRDGSAGYLGAVRFRLAEGECGCRYGGACRVGSRSQENAVRCVGGGRRCLRYAGRGAGNRASGASRSGSGGSDLADDSRAGERAVAARGGRIAGGCGAGGGANAC